MSPRIFGDALSVALRDHDLEVEVYPWEPGPNGEPTPRDRYDLAVTTGTLPSGVDADIVVVLAYERADNSSVTVIRRPGVEERRHLRGLRCVLGLIDDLLVRTA